MDVDMIHKAMIYAAEAHQGQYRKGGTTPYIVHPFEVAMILKGDGAHQETICAGLLHDVVEDTQKTILDIKGSFGDRIGEMVAAVTELSDGPWEVRKSDMLRRIAACQDQSILMIACADKLSNLRSVQYGLITKQTEQIWNEYKRPKEMIRQYYQDMIDAMKLLDRKGCYLELQDLFQTIFYPQQSSPKHNVTQG